MPTPRTRTTRRWTLFSAAVATAVMALTGCSGGSDGSGLYQSSGSAWDYVQIDGDSVVTIDPKRADFPQAIEDMETGDVDPAASYIGQTGTLNDARDTVIWDDGGDDPIEIADDMIRLDGDAYIALDSDQAKAAREKELADWHKHND